MSDTPTSDNSEGTASKPDKTESEGRRDLFRALALCVLAVLVVRSFLFEPFKIPSSSMVPTLHIGDYIFVSKFNFGLSLPFTKVEFVRWGGPERGDIIVFLFPRDESLHYIKRVIGVPGDEISFQGKQLFINGVSVPKEPITDPNVIAAIMGDPEADGEYYVERLGDTAHYVKYAVGANEFGRNSGPFVVPDGEYFVIGDNRDDSYDSRSWGFVPRANIKGKAQLIWVSIDSEGTWNNTGKIRWSRCGTIIQ